jgi:internalin A
MNDLIDFEQEVASWVWYESMYIPSEKIAVLSKDKLITIIKICKDAGVSDLNLSYCSIKELPREIKELKKLKRLILFSCNLEKLPEEIDQLNKLEILDLRDNPLSIPPEILHQINNPKAILKAYLSRVRRPLYEAKVIFVGQGGVGKTSLIRRVLQGGFNPGEEKTDGISINKWAIETLQEKEKIKINIWDFGGQEIMHATHQFFLTKRSLYLLVMDARLTQEENRIEYWLKIIQSFGGESPILIVGNKTDQHPLDIDSTGLKKKYPNIIGILETSAKTGAGIKKLEAEIAKQVDKLPHVRDLLPEMWFTVKSQLEVLGKSNNFITYDEYLALCNTNDIWDETSQRTLIGFLHDLGVILHFQDDPRLEALGILNPQWVTNGVYKILNSYELFQNQGKLTLSMLNKILNLPEYPTDKRLFIVDMMKKFELCYVIESDQSFLVPDLLPKDEPFTGEWRGSLTFQYHYNILPSSIITRFIVHMNAYIHKTVWRSGVIIKNGGNTALIKADMEDRKIYIWVNGVENTRRDFLSAIRIEFDAIHKTIAKIEATEKVPHPNYPELVLDYLELIEFELQSVDKFPRKVGDRVITCIVRELLDGVRLSRPEIKKVFISYSHDDKSFAKKIASELEIAGMKVWWDSSGLKGGQDWQEEIEKAIAQCQYFLIVLSPESILSEWVGNEITYAVQKGKLIIPLYMKPCEVPISIIKRQYIDFEKQTHKVALKQLVELLESEKMT